MTDEDIAALRERAERYRLIIDMIPQIVWTATPDGTQDFANLRWYEFNGLEQGKPDPEPWRSIIHPDDVATTGERWRHALATGEPYSCLHRNRRHDGEYRWVLSRALPQRDREGRILGWIGSGTDITEQKAAEAELLLYRDHLEELVRERTAELVVAKEKAEVASQAKSDFLSSMSHELRTPLNAVLGYAQILKRAANLTQAQKEQLEVLHASGEHLLKLINDLLDVGKIEARKMDVEKIPMSLPALLAQVYNITRVKAEEKQLALRYLPLTPLPPFVTGDERKLKQILLNLLANAVKFTGRGEVLLAARYDAGSQRFRCEIVDSGSGIPQERQKEIFEPFTQIHVAGSTPEGTGLGLTITRELVALMDGTMGVRSEEGRGSTFWIEIKLPPCGEVEVAADAPQRAVLGYRGPRKTVLVVDDVAANASMLAALLQPLGFRVLLAANGKEALSAVAKAAPDLVLLDLVMPEMDGVQVARELRRGGACAAVRIMGASASVTDSRQKEAFLALCDDFLEKPIQVAPLLEKIGRLLDIEWEFAVESPPVAPAPAGSSIEPPPREALQRLHVFALRGDLRKVLEWAVEEEKQRGGSLPFCLMLRDLVKGFKAQAILELVERHLGD